MCYDEPSLKRIAAAISDRALKPLAREGAVLPGGKTVNAIDNMAPKDIIAYASGLLENENFWLDNKGAIERFERVAGQGKTRDYLKAKIERAKVFN